MITMLAALVLVALSGRPRQFALAALALVYSAGYYAVLIVLSNVTHGGPGRYYVVSFLLLAYAVTVLLDSVLRDGTTLADKPGARRAAALGRGFQVHRPRGVRRACRLPGLVGHHKLERHGPAPATADLVCGACHRPGRVQPRGADGMDTDHAAAWGTAMARHPQLRPARSSG